MDTRLSLLLLHAIAAFASPSRLPDTSRTGASPGAGRGAAKRSGWAFAGAALSLILCPAFVYAAPPPASTTTTLGITAAGAAVTSVAAGTPVKLTATVASGATAVHPGTVNFCDASALHCVNAAFLGTAQLTTAGTASLSVRLPGGVHSVAAVFAGTKSYVGSKSATGQIAVTGLHATANSIAFSGVQGNYSLSSTVTSSGGTGVAPTGTVSFLDTTNGNAVLGSASLVGGVPVSSLSLVANASPTGKAPESLITGDFNGDGLADIVAANFNTNTVSVLLSNGNGTFTNKSTPAVGSGATGPVVGDFNGDGFLDIAVANFNDATVSVALGNGDGTFTVLAPISVGGEASYVGVGDFNGDGNLDLVVCGGSSTLNVLLGKGDGTFTAVATAIPTAAPIFYILAADLNGDGLADIFYPDAIDNTITVLLSNGDGTFTSKSYTVGNEPSIVVAGDFNGDGVLDLATGSGPVGELSVLLGKGDGTFNVSVTPSGVTGNVGLMAAADFNGDGILDLVTEGATTTSLRLFLGKGDGTFTAQSANYKDTTGTTGPYGIAVADFNGDGTIDIVTADATENTVPVLLNQVVSTATATATGISVPGGGLHMADASYPGDGIYAASASSTVTLDVPLVATTLSLSAFPSTTPYGRAPTLLATLSPSTSGSLTTNGETITFYKDGVAVGTGLLANGVASFSAGVLPIGTSILTAAYVSDDSFASSSSAAVGYVVTPPAKPSTIAISQTVSGSGVTSVALGTSVVYTATVLGSGQPLHPGQVQFCDASISLCKGNALLGTAELLANGTASVTLRFGLGSHLVKAVFAGTGAYSGSTSVTEALAVTGLRPTTTTIATSGTTGNYTLTATVAGAGSATGPSGSVSFLDTSNGNAVVGTAAFSANTSVRNFATVSSPATGAKPSSVVVADFNRDGIPDSATVNTTDNTVTILLGNGDGTFTAKAPITVGGSGAFQAAVGDFNGDDIPDLAIASANGPGTVTILLGKGDGTFTTVAGPVVASPVAIVSADLNGDGIADLAIATAANSVVVELGNGDGTFTASANPSTTGNLPSSMVVGDFNYDGILDLAVADYNDGMIILLLGNGDGTFQRQTGTIATGSQPEGLITQDLNGDGVLDLVAVNHGDGTLSVLLGNSNSTFTLLATPACGSSPVSVIAADVNGDGLTDFVVTNSGTPGHLTVLNGTISGTFTLQSTGIAAGASPGALVLADVNSDGLPDLIVADSGAANVTVFAGQIATTETATLSGVGVPGAGIHNVDANYAGDATYGASTSVTTPLNGSQVTTALVLHLSTTFNNFGQPVTLTAVLKPFAVGIAATTGETVTFLDNGATIGTGTLSGGLATFTISTLAVGHHSFTATYPGDVNFLSSAAVAVPYRVAPGVAPSTTMLSLSANGAPATTVAPGTLVTMTASVVGLGSPLTPGTINFCDATAFNCTGSAFFGTAQLNASGVATLKRVFATGGYQVAAKFAGTNSYSISTSATVALSVPGNTTTAISYSGAAGNYTLNATVSSTGSLVSPAGTVAFVDTTNSNSTFASAKLGAGTLTQQFIAKVTASATNLGPSAFGVADFNNDGKVDILWGGGNPVSVGGVFTSFSTIGLLKGNGDGTFTSSIITSTLTSGIDSIAVGNFNNDGIPDAVIGGPGGSVLILIGKGDGTFTQSSGPTLPDVSFGVVTGDFNGDGNLDVVVSTFGTVPPTYTILLGNGDGTFTAKAPITVSPYSPFSLPVVADFNRDGLLDFAVIQQNNVAMYLGNGDGTFTLQNSPISLGQLAGFAWDAGGDFNGDGIPDIAVTNNFLSVVVILLGNGDGTFTTESTLFHTGAGPEVISAGDFNGDGFMDLATANQADNTVSVLFGKGDGTFAPQQVLNSVATSNVLAPAGDFNGDGLSDLAAGSTNSSSVDTYLNSAAYTATATATGVSVPGSGIHYVDASYPGNAGYLASVSGTIPLTATPVIVPPNLTATAITLSPNPVTTSFGAPVTFSATLTPHAGTGTSADGETVNFLNNNIIIGSGTLSGGVANFTTSALAIGKSSLSAAYNGDANFAASVSGAISYTVTQASVGVTLALTVGGQPATTVTQNTSVLLTATVAKGATPISPGIVEFCDVNYVLCVGQGLLGTAQLNAQGVGKLMLRFGAGSHKVNAVFQPQKNYASGTSLNVALNVTGGTTTTSIASAGVQGTYTLTATTVGSGPVASPTGSVSFYDTTNSNALLGTAALGVATKGRAFVAGPPIYLTSNGPTAILRVDVNGDGIPDIVTLDYLPGNQSAGISVLLGKGDGTFTALPSFDPLSAGQAVLFAFNASLVSGDFNGDGIPDLALGVSDGGSPEVIILLGVGDGTFKPGPSTLGGFFALYPPTLAVADFNGDGIADLVICNVFPNSISSNSVYLGNGDGTFTSSAANINAYQDLSSVVTGDFNGDGHQDYAVLNGTSFQVALGNGDGTFAYHNSTLSVGSSQFLAESMAVGDFNGDGIPDLAIGNQFTNSIGVLLGNGDGSFALAAVSPTTGSDPIGVTVGDFNGDGLDDIATANDGGNSVTILLSNGDGSFTPQGADVPAGSGTYAIAAGDFNGDGQMDVAVVNRGNDDVQVVFNELTETAIAYLPNAQVTGAGAHLVDGVYAGDALFAGSTSKTITLNGFSATTTSLGLVSTASSGTYGGSITLTATLTPAGSPGTNGEVVSFRSGTTVVGTAALSGGVAALATTALPAGSDSVTAVYPGDSVYGSATSNAVAVQIAKASSTTTYVPAASATYGVTAAAAGILNATGTPTGGSFAYTATNGGTTVPVMASTLLGAGTYSLTATYTPADATDYATSSQTVAGFVVSKATPAVSWAAPAAIGYGTQLTGTQLDATSPVAGTFAYLPAAGAVLAVGNQTLGVTFTPTDTTDYTNATSSVTLTVNQGTPVITWATPAPIAFGAVLSATQLDATASVAGTFAYNPALGASLTAGSHTLQVTFTPTDTTDYTTATGSVTLLVGQGAPTITWATPTAIGYGTALSGTQLNATANVPGTFAYTPAAGAVLRAGPQTLGVTFTPTDTTTYTTATASVTLQVNQAAPAITWANPAAISYGTALSATQLNATASVGGTFAYTPAAGATPGVGAQTLKAVFTPTDAADYTSVTDMVTVQVTQATPVVTWPAPASVPYGTVLSATQLDATANTAGAFVYTPAAGSTLSGIGAQTLKVTFTPTDTADYTSVTDTVTVQVTQATPVVTWAAPAAIVYGTALSATQLNATASVAGSFAYAPAVGAVPAAGAQTLKVTFTPTDATDYAAATGTVSLAVTPAALTITPAAATRAYGAANPAFTYSATGFVNGDTAAVLGGAPVLTSAATATSAPGTYPITATQGTLAAANYSFAFAGGTLTITHAASVSTVSVSAASVPLGSPETVTVTVSSATTGTPTGSVTFLDGTTSLTTVALNNGQASYTTSSLATGAHTLNVSYAGDANFAVSTGSAAVTVSAVPADFTFAPGGNMTQTVLPGQTGTYSFALAPTQGAYPAAVTFAVAGLPAGATATFSPASVGVSSGAVTVTLSVQSAALTAAASENSLRGGLAPLALAMLLLPLAGARRMRRSGRRLRGYGFALLLLLAGAALATGLTGCGADTGFFGQSPKSYPLAVTATSGTAQHSATVTLIIE